MFEEVAVAALSIVEVDGVVDGAVFAEVARGFVRINSYGSYRRPSSHSLSWSVSAAFPLRTHSFESVAR